MFNNFQQRLRSFRFTRFGPEIHLLLLTWNTLLKKTWRTSQFIFAHIWPSLEHRRNKGQSPSLRPNATTRDPKRSSICRRKLRKEISIALIKQFITACWMEETFPISTFFFRSLFHFHLDVTAEFVSQHQRNKKKKTSEEEEEEKSILQNVTSRRRRSFAEAVARSILIFCSLPVW